MQTQSISQSEQIDYSEEATASGPCTDASSAIVSYNTSTSLPDDRVLMRDIG
uniref:Uncharacterized protein n=1 Tax=Amphimedon queenslandica TaxID=400682 RepID=A0A1X7TPN6_AMPQE